MPTTRDVELAKSDAVRVERGRLREYVVTEIKDESMAGDEKDKMFLKGWNAAMAAVRQRLS